MLAHVEILALKPLHLSTSRLTYVNKSVDSESQRNVRHIAIQVRSVGLAMLPLKKCSANAVRIGSQSPLHPPACSVDNTEHWPPRFARANSRGCQPEGKESFLRGAPSRVGPDMPAFARSNDRIGGNCMPLGDVCGARWMKRYSQEIN